MGSRILTNLGIFGTVAAFYTINSKTFIIWVMKGNPALAASLKKLHHKLKKTRGRKKLVNGENKKMYHLCGMASMLEKTGEKVFNGKIS